MDLAALHSNRAPAFIVHRGERLNFEFRPDRYDDKLHQQWGKWKITEGFDEGNQILLDLLVTWDLTDGGIPLPLNSQSITLVPVAIKLAMLKAIMDEVLSGKSSGHSLDGSTAISGQGAPTSTGSFA